ncbi:inhibitory regulator protein ira1-related [Anaeramoeba flamelloides]|uniref:Inhibitory regulator protein ira1-related n=1 Tax=Anaeramoeba flamelloides TaxID=1746091 RepID=A0AAV8A379_9EUKA|nr:inhibitory regulator protein ira1-related [Anaeramoeba flamelloides]
MYTHNEMLKSICQRIDSVLPLNKFSSYCATCVIFVPEEFIQKTIFRERKTLVIFSKTKANSVISQLATLLLSLTKHSYSHQEKNFEKLEQSFLIMMELLIQSLDFIFQKSYSEIDEYYQKNKKKILEDSIAEELTKIVYEIRFKREHSIFSEMINEYCGNLFKKISHVNFEVVFSRVTSMIDRITNQSNEEMKPEELVLMRYLDYDQKKLSELLASINQALKFFHKNYQIQLVSVIRQAIWNWINYHPEQFTELCKSQTILEGNPGILFDGILDWSHSAKKKHQYQYWPLLTMLLILCPKTLLQIAMRDEKSLQSTKGEYIETLKTNFKVKDQKKVLMAAACLIDFCKAATYVSKSDQAGLRLIVPQIQVLLRSRIFNEENPLQTDDLNLFVEFLISSFRLTPQDTTVDLLNACLGPNASPLYKLILVKSLVRIAKETPLEWNPSIEQTYSRAVDVKQVFYEYLNSLRRLQNTQLSLGKTGSLKSLTQNLNLKKKEREQMELANNQMKIVEETLKLFSTNPDFALVDYAINNEKVKTIITGEIKILFTTLPQCIDNSLSNEITHEAINFLKVLHKPEYIKKWAPKKIIESFFELNSMAQYIFANQIIDTQNLSQEQIVLWLDLLCDILRKKNEFLLSNLNNYQIPERIKLTHDQSNTRIENALLMLLCNSDPEVVSQAVDCFESLCQETKILDDFTNLNNTIALNYQNYKKMSQMGKYVTSRIAQQKNIRSLFRRIETATTGNIPSWTKIHQKWLDKTQRIEKYETLIQKEEGIKKKKNISKTTNLQNLDNYNQNIERIEWENQLGFLISLAAVAKKIVLSSTFKDKKEDDDNNSSYNEKSSISNDNYNDGSQSSNSSLQYTGDKSQVVIGTFLNQLLIHIVSDVDYVRGTVVKVITQMSTSVYQIFFKKIQELIQNDFKIFKKAKKKTFELKKSEIVIRFLDQTISILRGILEQPLNMDDLADVEIEQLFITIMKAIAKYVIELQHFNIRIKMCKLITLLMEKTDFILFKREIMFRNELVEFLMEWFSDFQKKISKNNNLKNNNPNIKKSNEDSNMLNGKRIKKLWDEIDLNAMQAVSKLLKGLTLQKPWIGNTKQPTGEEILKQKSTLFIQYFTFFTELLSRLREKNSNNINNNTTNNTQTKKKNEDSEFEKKLSQLTVIAISYMLHANVSVGLHHALQMGYVENLQTRSELIDVFTNILNHGTKFGSLKETLEDKYKNLIEMILDKDLVITKSISDIIKVTEMDLLAGILVRVNILNNSDIELLKFMIETEVANNPKNQPSTLFRRNSFASKMMSCYSKIIGKKYLQKTLSDVIQNLVNDIMINKKSIEIDERKLKQEETQDLEKNLNNLMELTQLFFDKIMNSFEFLPVNFFKIANILKITVENKFENCTNIVIAGFFFLRFICPAIISPENAEIVKERIPVEVRRALILITKSLQNLANGVMFGQKEEFMIPLNKFIEGNRENFNQLVIKLSNKSYLDNLKNSKESNNNNKNINIESEKEKDKQNEDENDKDKKIEELILNEEISSEDLNSLHQFLYLNLQNLSVYFKRLKNSDDAKKGESFVSLLTQLGKPTKIEKKNNEQIQNKNILNNDLIETNSKKKSDKKYKEFLIKMKGKEKLLKQFNDIIYSNGKTKQNESILYVISQKFRPDIDEELLLYHILNTLKPLVGRPYIILFDCSNFNVLNEISKYWCNQLIQHIPFSWSINFKQMILLNPNSVFKKYYKKIHSIIPNKLNKYINILSNSQDLNKYIATNHIYLPEDTLELDTSITKTIDKVYQQSSRVKNTEVKFQFSNSFLKIIQLKENLLNKNCHLIDIIPISQINSINKTVGTQDQFRLEMIIDGEQKNINYKSQFVNEIINTVQTMKEKYNFSKKTSNKGGSVPEIRPSDVPGTLLNIALLNLGSQSEGLRKSSYNLLTALCNSFNFEMSNEMLETEGLSIPQSHTSFVVNLSKSIAQNEKHITLEFLNETSKHYNQASSEGKHLCLEYISPWIINLKDFIKMNSGIIGNSNTNTNTTTLPMTTNDENNNSIVSKENKTLLVKKIIQDLLNITLRENKLYPAILVHIWKSISLVNELFELILDVFIEQSIKLGIQTSESERIAQITVTVASTHKEIFSKLICKKLSNCLYLASHQENRNQNKNEIINLEDYEKWDEVLILIRFLLYLSFENLVSLENNLPDIFHFVLVTHHSNDIYLRTWLLSLVINIFHSLSTKLPPKMEEDYETLLNLLNEISDIRFRMLFTGSGLKQNELLMSNTKQRISRNLSRIPIENSEKICKIFKRVMTCYKNNTELYDGWQSKWLQLATETAFDNSLIQARSFLILGVINTDEIQSKLIEKILTYFRSLIAKPDFTNQINRDLCSSMIISITHLYPLLNEQSDLLFTMFWVALILLQLGDQYYFYHALDMLSVVLNYLDQQQVFDETPLEVVFMTVRKDDKRLDVSLRKLEQMVGINFHSHFSFAFTLLLLQARGSSTLKVKMISIFRKIIEISCKTQLNSGRSAYIVGLATCLGTKEISELRDFLGNYIDWEGELEQLMFSTTINHDIYTSTLLVSLLSSILVQSDYEQEHRFILELLIPSIDSFPQVYPALRHILAPKLYQILNQTQDSTVHKSALKITNFILTDLKKPKPEFLGKIGFKGMLDLVCAKIEPEIIHKRGRYISNLLSLFH